MLSIYEHLLSFYDLPVCDRESVRELPADAAWRITGMSPYGDSGAPSLKEDLDDLLSRVDGTRIRAIVVGQWGPDYDAPAEVAVEALAGAADRLFTVRRCPGPSVRSPSPVPPPFRR
ncbi:hypothetical protein [Nonomuraea sp. NEAU-A123]|uniref:hypothetical protein n=1 Tax=Nonomuraea sp. NEAU-A123 TaxID=2839649 RepID=UPI001BE49F45|nr:hypothetical protein [Nonomuraea sp. NEAU-A123]MBT2233028.1 hypothetical protein [Nonomuraea sp. NEAU-A123]